MTRSRWIALLLMASFATFFVGGMHLRFSPLTLVLGWFAGVLTIAWLWTRWSERRARQHWLAVLEDPNGAIFTESARSDLIRALDAWEDARLSERKLFDELLVRRREAFLAAAREAVSVFDQSASTELLSTFLTRILHAYRDDDSFMRSFLDLLEGTDRAELWRLVASVGGEEVPYDSPD